MKKNETNEPFMGGCCAHSRRAFLTHCAKCVGAVGAIGAFSGLAIPTTIFANNSCTSSAASMKIRVVFALHAPVQDRPDWPNLGFDFNPVMETIMSSLINGCRDVEFVSSMVDGREATEKLIAADNTAGNIDGYLVVQLNCWNLAVQQLCETGKPVLYADFLYAGSGGFLTYTARLLNANTPNFAFMSSGNFSHVVAAANCFPLVKGAGGIKSFVDGVTKIRKDIVAKVNVDMKCVNDEVDLLSTSALLNELKTKKILAFEGGGNLVEPIKDSFGIQLELCKFAEVNDLWEKANKGQAMEVVNRWKKTSNEILDVSDETLEKSARFYLAMKQCLKNHDACAITINCLGGFYGGHIQAYPCLGFHELLNEGLIGACECDVRSTLTEVVMTTMTKGRPGYISDPVMDVETKQIIYAHCVASNKPFGPNKASNPFTILTHSEDRKGASLRSTLPIGYMTTTVEMNPTRKEILFHQGKIVANSTQDRACRTKIAAVPVGDYEKLFTEWGRWGWHRVTYYGDLKKPVFDLAKAIGWTIVEEA